MKSIILALLIITFSGSVIAQKSFLDDVSINVTPGYSSPMSDLSKYNSGSIGINASVSYNFHKNTQAVLSFDRASFGYNFCRRNKS
jgi:hypothetical protein